VETNNNKQEGTHLGVSGGSMDSKNFGSSMAKVKAVLKEIKDILSTTFLKNSRAFSLEAREGEEKEDNLKKVKEEKT